MKQITVRQFDGKISDSKKQRKYNAYAMARHFTVEKNRLVPNRNTETDEAPASGGDFRDFIFASNNNLYAFGKKTTTNVTKIYFKTDLTDNSWTGVTAEGNGAFKNVALNEYKGYIWGFQGSNQIFKFYLTDNTITDSVATVGATISTVAKGVIAKDDCLYMAYNNVIVRNNNGSITDAVLTLPTNNIITSLENYGNYLAIASQTFGSYGKSYIYLWDLVSDDVLEVIDLGEGAIKVLGNVEGRLVAVIDKYTSSSYGLQNGSMIIKMWAGGTPQLVKEVKIVGKNSTRGVSTYKEQRNNKLYFIAQIPNSATTSDEGIWEFGRDAQTDEFGLTLFYQEQTIPNDAVGIDGFGAAYDYFFIAHSGDSSISRTSDTATYTFTSTYESQEFSDEDLKRINVKILGVYFDKLPTDGQVVAKFRKDGASAWTTLFTHTTDDSTYKEYPFNVPSECNYFQIRLESIGGSVITGFIVQYDTVNTMV